MRPKDHSDRLRELGIVPTIQRIAILEHLEGTKCHPTAEQVYTAVRNQFPSISRATVYNTLDRLTSAGAVLRLCLEPSAARYDADTSIHGHFRCRACGSVYDIDVTAPLEVDEEIDGHRIEAIRTHAYGVCANCRAAGKERAAPETEETDA